MLDYSVLVVLQFVFMVLSVLEVLSIMECPVSTHKVRHAKDQMPKLYPQIWNKCHSPDTNMFLWFTLLISSLVFGSMLD